MEDIIANTAVAFAGAQRIASGPLEKVALAVKAATESGAQGPVLAFDIATGRVIDIDIRGTADEVIARLQPVVAAEVRGPGRPKLGVVAREVTLLPRHWDWLSAQPGGASVTLRKLVEEARRAGGGKAQARATQEAAYRFMSAMAGDYPDFEEASRALFANDRARFAARIAAWPADVQDQVMRMAFDAKAVGA